MGQIPPVNTDPVHELRLALVCYGGVSLAIYMHGTTKEIHKLVRASHAYEIDADTNPFTGDDEKTESAYWHVLKDKHAAEGVRTRVVVDIITGTSAGGINGICLATVLAHNTSQNPLRDLWMVEGDMSRLLRSPLPDLVPWKLRAAFWASQSLTSIGVLRSVKPPLRGDRMCQVLYDALAEMTDAGTSTLIPDGLSLQLFVTTTDLRGYRRFLRIKDRMIEDRTHRVVMRFQYDATGASLPPSAEQRDDFTPKQVGALAFAARATSSFPGAFPPIGLPTFTRDLEEDGQDRAVNPDVLRGFLPAYTAPFASLTRAWFIDGGVLDNKPFGYAVDAIVGKPASTEVTRWLIYLDPDPADTHDVLDDEGETPDGEPTLLQTVIPALSGIPRSEPILDELTRLRQFNERIADLNRVVRPLLEDLTNELDDMTTLLDAGETPTAAQMSAAIDAANEEATIGLGATYTTYLRLRLRSIAESLSATISNAYGLPPESAQAAFVHTLLSEWQDDKFGRQPTSPETIRYIDQTDIQYRIRRLLFVAQGVNEMYGRRSPTPAQRRELDEAKHEIYSSIDQINGLLSPTMVLQVLAGVDLEGAADPFVFVGEVSTQSPVAATDSRLIAKEQAAPLNTMMTQLASYLGDETSESSLELLTSFTEMSQDWDPSLRNALVIRFVGFPKLDTAVFPLMSLSDIQQFAPIQIARFSPDAATRLPGKGKPQGIGAARFAAFFKRSSRENDYLIGRLDGAEQLLNLLYSSSISVELPNSSLDAVLRSVLDEEAGSLLTARKTIEHFRGELSVPTLGQAQ